MALTEFQRRMSDKYTQSKDTPKVEKSSSLYKTLTPEEIMAARTKARAQLDAIARKNDLADKQDTSQK